MKILLISGSQNPRGATSEAVSFAEETILRLGKEVIKHTVSSVSWACTGCGYCKKNGECIASDLSSLYKKAETSDAIMIFTPTHYLGASPALTADLSRLFMSRMSAVKGKPAAVVAVGRRAGLTSAISEVLKFFSFSASPIANGPYPAAYYGKGDGEGRESVELLAESLVWLTDAVMRAKAQGLTPPSLERRCKTDLRSVRSEG